MNETTVTIETDTDEHPVVESPADAVPFARRHRVRLVSSAAALVLIAGGLFLWSPWSSGVPSGAALVVDGHVVTVKQLDARMDALRALYGVVRPTEPKALDTFRRDAAKSIAVSMLLDNQVDDRGIRVSDKKARDALDRFVSQQFGDGGRDEFVRSLGNVGTSEKEVLEEIRRQLGLQLLIDDVVGKIQVSDSELSRQFEQRKAELGTPEQRTVRNIVVEDEATAGDVKKRLAKGESITNVAADVSLDESSKDKGGNLGAVGREELEPAVAHAVFKTPKAGLYGPVKGQFGWNVGRVDAITPGKPAQFAAVRDSFRQQLISEEGPRRWWHWITGQLRSANVEYAKDYRPSNPDAAPGNANGLPASPSPSGAPQ